MSSNPIIDSQTGSGTGEKKLAIEINGVHKAYGRVPVLRKLDLDVPWGKVLTILGRNGSGKTTLIKILGTLTRSDSGTVRIAGSDITRAGQSVRRLIGIVTHDALLYEELTGRENLKFAARMFRLDRAEERIASVVERMGVTARLDQRIGTMSHGLKKRFSIARALLHDPVILMMDEPESGLDQDALAMLEAVITDHTDPFRTVLMTTHNLERGLELGDRTAILARGRIAYHESLETVGAAAVRDAYVRITGPTD